MPNLVAATFLTLMVIQVGQRRSLTTRRPSGEHRKTNLFYNEWQRAVLSAKSSPDAPIILEAYGPAHMGGFSLSYSCRRSGPRNRIAVRRIRPEIGGESLMRAFGKRCPGSSRRATAPSRPTRHSDRQPQRLHQYRIERHSRRGLLRVSGQYALS